MRFVGTLLLCGAVLVGCGQPASEPKRTGVSESSTANEVAVVPVSAGERLYKTCSACHLPTGEGVPGAFPSLKGDVARFMTTDAGRDYLIAVVKYGLQGEIVTSDGRYSGVMASQAQRWSPAEIADVLNYISTEFHSGASVEVVTEDEVTSALERFGSLPPQKVATLRPKVPN